jgi:hypothetical protein
MSAGDQSISFGSQLSSNSTALCFPWREVTGRTALRSCSRALHKEKFEFRQSEWSPFLSEKDSSNNDRIGRGTLRMHMSQWDLLFGFYIASQKSDEILLWSHRLLIYQVFLWDHAILSGKIPRVQSIKIVSFINKIVSSKSTRIEQARWGGAGDRKNLVLGDLRLGASLRRERGQLPWHFPIEIYCCLSKPGTPCTAHSHALKRISTKYFQKAKMYSQPHKLTENY